MPALSSDWPRAESDAFEGGTGPDGVGEARGCSLWSRHACQLKKGHVDPSSQPKWHAVQELLSHGV